MIANRVSDANPRAGLLGRVIWAVVFVLLGIGIVLGGWQVANGFFNLDTTNASYWAGALANIGTTLVLAIVLVLFEQRIVRRVATENENLREAVRDDVEVRVDALREEGKKATEDILTRITDLNAQLATARAENRAEQVEAVAALMEGASFESTARLISEAAEIDAIKNNDDGGGWLTVRGGSDPEAPRIRVDLHPAVDSAVEVKASQIGMSYTDGSGRVFDVFWASGHELASALVALDRQLVRANSAELARKLDAASFIENLRTALDQAIKSREKVDDGWLNDTLLEWLGDDWAVTSWGVEHREWGLVIPEHAYPKGTAWGIEGPSFSPRPAHIDEAAFEQAKAIGAAYFDTSPSDDSHW